MRGSVSSSRGSVSLRQLKTHIQRMSAESTSAQMRRSFNELAKRGVQRIEFEEARRVLAGGAARPMVKLLGTSLLSPTNTTKRLPTGKVLEPYTHVGLLFTWSRCNPCKRFMRKLKKYQKSHPEMAVVHVPFSKELRFHRYLKDNKRDHYFGLANKSDASRLERRFGITKVPSLVVVDRESGRVLTERGKDDVEKGRSFSDPVPEIVCKDTGSLCRTHEGCHCMYKGCRSGHNVVCKPVPKNVKRVPQKFGWAGPGTDLALCQTHRLELFTKYPHLYEKKSLKQEESRRCLLRAKDPGWRSKVPVWKSETEMPCEREASTFPSLEDVEESKLRKLVAPCVRRNLRKTKTRIPICSECMQYWSQKDPHLWLKILAGVAAVAGAAAIAYKLMPASSSASADASSGAGAGAGADAGAGNS